MNIEIREEPLTALGEYARIDAAFEVRQILDPVVRDGGLGGIELMERTLPVPFVKDYDAIKGDNISLLPQRFDLTNWGLLAAYVDQRRVGGVIVAFNTQNIDMLERHTDLAVLWDIRVAPDARGKGVGVQLFHALEAWSKQRGCRQLKIETQNVNVPACRFYAKQGCVLGAIHRFAYPELPNEVQMLWYKDL
jgi:GNAT superfamily N-acetyltransferase